MLSIAIYLLLDAMNVRLSDIEVLKAVVLKLWVDHVYRRTDGRWERKSSRFRGRAFLTNWVEQNYM